MSGRQERRSQRSRLRRPLRLPAISLYFQLTLFQPHLLSYLLISPHDLAPLKAFWRDDSVFYVLLLFFIFHTIVRSSLMAKLSQQNHKNTANSNANSLSVTKVKRTRKTIPRDSPPQRSSIYRGVTRWKGDWVVICCDEVVVVVGAYVYMHWLWLFQASMDWPVWGSFVGQELLEWITEQERKTRLATTW